MVPWSLFICFVKKDRVHVRTSAFPAVKMDKQIPAHSKFVMNGIKNKPVAAVYNAPANNPFRLRAMYKPVKLSISKPVKKKLMEYPSIPISSTGRRPARSEIFPQSGAVKNEASE